MAAREAVLIRSTSGGSSTRQAKWAESAFESIFVEYYARVVAVLDRLLGNRAEAEELASDVFAKLYQQSLPADREHHLGGWLYRTATRLGIDNLRAASRRMRYEQAARREAAEGDPSPNPLDAALRAERCRQVRATLARLKPAQAQLLMLRSSGLSYRELAEAIGMQPSSIGTLLARAEAEFERTHRRLHPS